MKSVKTYFKKGESHRWRNRGDRMGIGPPLLFLGGPAPSLLNFHFCLNSNTFGIESIVKVNRLMKNVVEFW